MQAQLDITRITRGNALNLIKDLSDEALNHIPEKFNNNIIWNLGHMVVTQELLTYGLSGITGICSPEMLAAYKIRTKPEGIVSKEEIEQIKSLMVESVNHLQSDYTNGIFKEFKTYSTSYNMTLDSVESAITFNNVHEGMHFGSILALRKLV